MMFLENDGKTSQNAMLKSRAAAMSPCLDMTEPFCGLKSAADGSSGSSRTGYQLVWLENPVFMLFPASSIDFSDLPAMFDH